MNCPHYFLASEDTGNVLLRWDGDESRTQIFIPGNELNGASPLYISMFLNKAAKIGFDARADVIKRVLEIK